MNKNPLEVLKGKYFFSMLMAFGIIAMVLVPAFYELSPLTVATELTSLALVLIGYLGNFYLGTND